MESPGEFLKKKREEYGRSLEEVSQKTHIRRDELRNLEADLYGFAPAEVYIVGALTAYARALGVDPDYVLELYHARVGSVEGEAAGESVDEGRAGSRWKYVLAVCAAVVVLGALAVMLGRRDRVRYEEPPPADFGSAAPETVVVPHVVDRPPPPRVVLEMSVQETTWVGLEIDRSRRDSALLSPGAWRRWEADSVFSITIGNAAGVALTLDGEPVKLPEIHGKVVILELPFE